MNKNVLLKHECLAAHDLFVHKPFQNIFYLPPKAGYLGSFGAVAGPCVPGIQSAHN
jgi:hypothetical protein